MDYALQLQITIRFIDKALETEDRLDIFKALQKTYDALEGEYDEDTYGDIIDRIERTLNGLNENFISTSDLKKLTKFILSEIALVQRSPNSPIGFFKALMNKLQSQRDANPVVNDATIAQKLSKNLISHLRKSIQSIVNATVKKSKQEYEMAAKEFVDYTDDLLGIVILWVQKIDSADKSRRGDIDRIMEEFRNHVIQMRNQIKLVIDDLKIYGNYINATNKMKLSK